MAVNATPNIPSNAVPLNSYVKNAVKVASPDLILYDDSELPLALTNELIFEEIAGQEIISITRHDLIDGQNVVYSPIKNTKSVFLQNNPLNITSLQGSADKYFASFPIKMEDYVALNEASVYYDKASRSVVIEVSDIPAGKQVEVQILSAGSILDDTIY
jgi:hypothetical protein